eukprot:1158730-Pelagomonas_calceolata.AAC.12
MRLMLPKSDTKTYCSLNCNTKEQVTQQRAWQPLPLPILNDIPNFNICFPPPPPQTQFNITHRQLFGALLQKGCRCLVGGAGSPCSGAPHTSQYKVPCLQRRYLVEHSHKKSCQCLGCGSGSTRSDASHISCFILINAVQTSILANSTPFGGQLQRSRQCLGGGAGSACSGARAAVLSQGMGTRMALCGCPVLAPPRMMTASCK